MIQRILLPLDGSERAERAIPWVAALARAFKSEVILLRVVEGVGNGEGRASDPVEWRLDRAEAVAYLQEIKARLAKGAITVDIDVGVGGAGEEILETARVRQVDLVAITTHGRGEAMGLPMAGTAHKVIVAAETSVLVVPAAAAGAPVAPRRVLVGVDGSPRSEWAACLSATLARSESMPLVLAYAIPAPEILPVGDVEPLRALATQLVEASRKVGERYLADLANRLDAPELHLSVRAVEATTTVPRALCDLACEEPGTLLVLSARGGSAPSGCLYGSVARPMVASGDHPILVLQDVQSGSPAREPAPERTDRSRRREGLQES